jgi:hypothetical protein
MTEIGKIENNRVRCGRTESGAVRRYLLTAALLAAEIRLHRGALLRVGFSSVFCAVFSLYRMNEELKVVSVFGQLRQYKYNQYC